MSKYIPRILFAFSYPVLSADIHWQVVDVLDDDLYQSKALPAGGAGRLVNTNEPENKRDYDR